MSSSDLLDVTQDPIYQELLSEYPKASPEGIECALQCLRVAAWVNLKQEQKLTEYGLTSGRFYILMLLRREENRSLSPSELAKRSKVTRGTMTQFIDCLERDGLVKRIDDAYDRRAMLIQLTTKADNLLKKILPIHLERLSLITQVLSRTERKTLIDLMEKVRDGIAAHDTELE